MCASDSALLLFDGKVVFRGNVPHNNMRLVLTLADGGRLETRCQGRNFTGADGLPYAWLRPHVSFTGRTVHAVDARRVER